MKRKVALLAVLCFAFTAVLGFSALDNDKASAAPLLQKVNFTNAQVTAAALHVREGAGTNYRIVCTLYKGQTVRVLGKIGEWYAIYETKGGCVGAVHGDYIKPVTGTAAPKPTAKPQAPAATKAPPPAQTQPPAETPTTPAVPSGITAEEQTLLELCNKARADAGAGPLAFDMELVKCARAKARDMVENNYFSHQSPTYGSPFDMMRQFGISFKTAGENIAGNQTVEGAFKAWMNSEGHRKNILNANFNYAGFGIEPSKTYGKMLVQQFIGR